MAKIARASTELADAEAIVAALGAPVDGTLTVAALLADSRAAHQQYIRVSHHWTPVIGQPNPNADPEQARANFRQAAQRRAYAEVLDPTHSDPAWAQEYGTNYENGPLLFFYRDILVQTVRAKLRKVADAVEEVIEELVVEEAEALIHTEYCGVPLRGGWCKRAVGHEGPHACA